MSYINPLHPPIRSAHQSQYTSLGGALQSTSSSFLSPTRQRLPQQSYTPKTRSSYGRLHAPIVFDHPGYAKQGVQMREIVARSIGALAGIIQGGADAVFAQIGLSRITLKIMWPGYEHLDWSNTIDLSAGVYGPITRAQLGAAISNNFLRFFEKARTEPSRSSEWNLSSSTVRFEHLVLVALINVAEDVWQADVAVDVR